MLNRIKIKKFKLIELVCITSDNCSPTSYIKIIMGVILGIGFFIILLFRILTFFRLRKLMKNNLSEVYNKVKRIQNFILASTVIFAIIAIFMYALNKYTIRIRDIFMFYDETDETTFSLAKVILGTFLWPLFSNYLIFVVFLINVKWVDFQEWVNSILYSFEALHLISEVSWFIWEKKKGGDGPFM